MELRREPEITAQRFEHMLPRARGGFVPHGNRFAALQRAAAVGHDAVLGPVAAADDVAGAGAGDLHRMIFEEGPPPRADGESGLA